MQQSFLTVKLRELEREQGKLQARIRVSQRDDPEEIKKEIHKLKAECEEEDILLRQSVENSHSKAVTALADAHLSYDKTMENIAEKILMESVHGGDTFREDRAEAAMLYAEVSIDFAVRASRNALLAALKAITLEMESQETEERQ